MPMLTDAHMGNLEWQAYRVVPSREGMQNPVSAQKAEADVLCVCIYVVEMVLSPDPPPDPNHKLVSANL